MKKILNFGSLNIDHVYSVDHFVEPGETTSSLRYEIFPGGKGLNQSIALSLAGGEVFHAGKIGADGAQLVKLLAEKGVDVSYIDDKGSYTGHAIIQVNKKGQNCILLHGGANVEIAATFMDEVLSDFGQGDLLVLQNEINDVSILIEKARSKGLDIALNPSPFSAGLLDYPLHKVTWFLLNEIEGQEISGQSDPDRICDSLLERYPAARIVLTLGKKGVLYRDAAQRHTHGIYDIPVIDTTAAGDTFTGFFLSCATSGMSIAESLRLASIASSLAVSKKGAAVSIPTLDEVRKSEIKLLV